MQDEAWTATTTGYEPQAVQSSTSGSSASIPIRRLDVRWGRLTFAQLRDEEFLAKQLRRIEITQGARRVGRPIGSGNGDAPISTGSSPRRTIRQRLQAAQTKAARGISEDEESDTKETEAILEQGTALLGYSDDDKELLNALCMLGGLQQPELAALMIKKLKQSLKRLCTFPNPVYQLIALRRQLMKSMHETVAAQHRQHKAAVQSNLSIIERLQNSPRLDESTSNETSELIPTTQATKPKEKAAREAAMGIQVLVGLLSDLHDPIISSLAQRRDFLSDLLPLLHGMGFMALSPKSPGLSSFASRGSAATTPGAGNITDFIEKTQRFLLDMCPRPVTKSISSASPKLPAIASASGDLDILDRTNAVNGLIHLAAATSSVGDFLVVLKVLLGADDFGSDAMTKELRTSSSSRSLSFSAAITSLSTVPTEECVSSPAHSGRDSGITGLRNTGRDSSVDFADKADDRSPTNERDTEALVDSTIHDILKRKTIPKGIKVVTPSSNGSALTANLSLTHSPQHHRLFSTPDNNLVSKYRTEDEINDSILFGSTNLPLDMSKMKDTLSRDSPSFAVPTNRGDIPVVVARCPKFKALHIQSVLSELDRAKPSEPTRSSTKKSSGPRINNETCSFTGDDEVEDREVWSCGQNSYGELGHGDTTSRKSFERIEALQQKDIVQIGAGNEHTITLTADGKILTCGYNDNGQCGQGGTSRVSYLTEVPKMGDTCIAQVHAYNGCEHTILVTTEGRVATCGYNYRGQLGHGNTASESVPKLVRSLENRIVRLVSCSYYHTVMACEEDGSGLHCLYTFGRNDYGQLGHNDAIDRKVPQHVDALNDQHVVSVACGQYHTMVVTASGKAFAFGKNDYGQLGIDSMENQLVPVQVRAGLDKQECLEIRCGYYHTIVLCSGAHLFGFGRNDYGQLGLGHPNDSSTTNLQLQQQRFSYARLIEELEGKDIVQFACGCYHTLAVSDNGIMYVFGRNNHGQLGTGDTNERVYPFPIDDFAGKRVAMIAAGFYHTVVLTGGKEEEKNYQETGGNEKRDGSSSSSSNGITHISILAAPVVQQLFDPTKKIKTNDEDIDAGAEVPAVDPTEEDFRDEDNHLESPRTGYGSASKIAVDSADPLLIAVVVMAQLDRLCQPFIPKQGTFPTMQHPTMSVIDAIQKSTSSSPTSSLDLSKAFEGSFEALGVHACSSTFETLAVLLKHFSTKKIDAPSHLTAWFQPRPSHVVSTATTARALQANSSCHIQVYMLLACLRILQANLSQLLRSGMAKTVTLLSQSSSRSKVAMKSSHKELDLMRVAFLQIRDVLLSLIDIKHRRNVCYILDCAPTEGENTTRIADEATSTLMLGFEVFFPCQCLQRQMCMHVIHDIPSDGISPSCGVFCRRELWSIDSLPKSKGILLGPLLRRMAEDPLVIRFLPLASTPVSLSPGQQLSAVNAALNPGLSVTEMYEMLLERTAADFARNLGNIAAVEPPSSTQSRQAATALAFFETLTALQKHLSSWAGSIHEWSMKLDNEDPTLIIDFEARVSSMIDRAFHVDEQDLCRVPTAWRCFIEFALAAIGQCCEVLGQVTTKDPVPSPTNGYNRTDNCSSDQQIHATIREAVENSIVGQLLPSLVVSLFEFSNNPLFAAALLPKTTILLRLLDIFNQRDSAADEAEKVFVESIASSGTSRPQVIESKASFRRMSGRNLLGNDVKAVGKREFTPADAFVLPWHYRLQKELAVLSTEMAMTLVVGDPLFSYDLDDNNRSKVSERWISSPLFRGGLNVKLFTLTRNQHNPNLSNHARVIQHTPFPTTTVSGFDCQPFTLVLPPPPAQQQVNNTWKIPTEANYVQMFRPEAVRGFLVALQDEDGTDNTCMTTHKLCEWVRDSYVKKDPSYRMIIRQSQLAMNLKASANAVDQQIHANDLKIESAFFAALLHHNTLGPQAYHFALGLTALAERRASPPRAFTNLWQRVAQLRRRIATKKTEIKNMPTNSSNVAGETPRLGSLDRIISFQQAILDRCKLLLLVNVYGEEKHLNLQFDAGYIAPCDPAFAISATSAFKFSAPSAMKHLQASYTDDKVPFLTAFPGSKWRKIRVLMHTLIRWKAAKNAFANVSGDISQEALAYVTSDENVSSNSAIKAILVDPCRRVSCSVRGLESLWEILTLATFDSILVDIVHQISQVFVFHSSEHSLLGRAMESQNAGYFYSSLQNEVFFELVGKLTELMTDKAALLLDAGELEITPSFWVVIALLSTWGIRFNIEQFEFVSDISILNVIREMLQSISRRRCELNGDSNPDSVLGRSGVQSTLAQLTASKQLNRLKDTLWVLFRHICVHFAVQNVHQHTDNGIVSLPEIYVPTFPVLSGVAELLYDEAAAISNGFLPLLASDGSLCAEEQASTTSIAVRRSFEVIIQPHRFSSQSKGVTCSYSDMVSPSEAEAVTPMSPLLKPNEFSVTTWLYVNNSPTSSSQTASGSLIESNSTTQDRQLVFLRGAAREISLYLLLVPETFGNWQLEVGILIASGNETACYGDRMWERLLSKQVVAGSKWIHVAVIMEASKIRLYLNGVLDCQRSLSAQCLSLWAEGTVDLPIHFGRCLTTPESTIANCSSSEAAVSASSATSFLSSTLGITKPPLGWTSNNSTEASLRRRAAFKCFDGWLCHFRFHNRSLSPIHVRIVFDEKKSPSGLPSDNPVDVNSKVMELHALLLLLSSSSEGLVHFTAQFSKWMRLLWGTFLGSSSALIQQSALRVLRTILVFQHPLEVSKVLLQCDAHTTEALGFYDVDMFVQQVIRLIGFCLFKCPQRGLVQGDSEPVIAPWTLMLAQGIHGNQFSPEVRTESGEQTDLPDDIESQYQSSKRRCVMLANDLVELLQQLFRSRNDVWKQSITRAMSTIAAKTSLSSETECYEQPAIRLGKHALHLSTIKRVETAGCLYVLGGGIEYLRPGVAVEMRGSKNCVQVISLKVRAPNPADTLSSDTPAAKDSDMLACVHNLDNSSDIVNASSSLGWNSRSVNDNTMAWYKKVFSHHTEDQKEFAVVSTDELNPVAATTANGDNAHVSVMHDLVYQERHSELLSVLVQKAEELIPALYVSGKSTDDGVETNLLSVHIGCTLLKVLGQIAGSGAGVDELLPKSTLIDALVELAISTDANPKFGTLQQAERKVSALRREIHAAMIELGEEGESELASAFAAIRDNSQEYGTECDEELGVDEMNVADADEYRPSKVSWGPVQGEEPDPIANAQVEDEGDDIEGGEGEDDDGDEESLDDEDNGEDEEDEDDEADAEATRAEFVEELMLMGFPEDWCVLALKQTENDIVGASAWIVDNLEYLSKLQSSLDKERDKNRDSPRFDEEDDDFDTLTENPTSGSSQPPSLNASNSWVQSASWRGTESMANVEEHAGMSLDIKDFTSDDHKIPPLNDKEMGRKLFAEMYFPFEDGGYLSNTKSRFMRTWRTEAMEMKTKAVPSTTEPISENERDASPFEEEFQTKISQLDLQALLKLLRTFENSLAILYARQAMVALMHHVSACVTGVENALLTQLMIPYEQVFNLMKLAMLRGDQFTIISSSRPTTGGRWKLHEYSTADVFTRALKYFVRKDPSVFTTAAFDFCLGELEAAAANKTYEAILWTQRALQRTDKTVIDEPGVELVVWMLDTLLTGSINSSFTFPTDVGKTIIRRLRCCLGTANLPLKFVVLRTSSRLLSVLSRQNSPEKLESVVHESQLVVGEFLAAANMRHGRELVQDRLLFSQYLQGYVEILHVLQRLRSFEGFSVPCPLTGDVLAQSSISSTGDGESFLAPAASLNPPISSGQPKNGNCSLMFDRKRSRSSLLNFAEDSMSVSYSGNEVWKAACAVVGFSTGVHCWEVRIDKSSSPYLFVGVASRQANLDSFLGADDQSWGFIGDKALYYQRNRIRAYGETFTEGDCIGLRLDCEKGELSFSKNGVDLGMAFDNIVGEVCPAVAFYSRHQKISFARDSYVNCSGAEIFTTGEDGQASVEDCLIVCEMMSNWVANKPMRVLTSAAVFKMTSAWLAGSTKFVTTRSGKSLWVDVTKEGCGRLGFASDDRVRTPRGNGVVVGVAAGRIWVEVDNEPGAWYFHPSKLRLVTMTSSTTTNSLTPRLGSDQTGLRTARNGAEDTKVIELDGGNNPISASDVATPSLTLSQQELTQYGGHALWNIAVDRELLGVVNDLCEVSRLSPWNLTPTQLLKLIEEKATLLEVTSMASIFALAQEKREKMVVARFAILRYGNLYVSRALPFFDLTWHYFLPEASPLPCHLVSQCRGSLFVCVKNALFTSLMEKTANSPKKSDDEYDYPEDLPQLQVNRLKAAAAKCHQGTINSLFLSLFGQAFEELHFLPLKTLRMVYSHPMDDGQLRSFKVKFEGEGVDDYGGPYREFFSQFFAELQMLHEPESASGSNNAAISSIEGGNVSLKQESGVPVSSCMLPFFLPSPNWRNGVGANREKFVLNGALITRQFNDSGSENIKQGANDGQVHSEDRSLCESAEERRQLFCEMLYFLGQMFGTCLRTRVCVRLDLAMSVWKQLVAEDDSNPESALETLREIDFVAYSLWKTLQGILDDFRRLQSAANSHPDVASVRHRELEEQLAAMDLDFTTILSDGRTVELCADGTNTAVTLANLEKYLGAMLRARVEETQEVMNIIKQGLHSIMPVSALALLTWSELEKRMCGVAEVDVKLLQANTEYDDGLSANDEFIQRFWRVLESFESEDKRAFLRFVWARSRLPQGSAQFHQKFKIQALASSGTDNTSAGATTTGGWMDSQMPKSHTCFFALQLPRYSTDDICRDRVLYAVRNCVEMDGDFRLADNEMTGWTGINPTDQLRI